MSAGIFLLILLSASLHAGWNLISKQGRPSIAFFFLMSGGNCLLWSWTLPVLQPDWSSFDWMFGLALTASVGAECLYLIGIVHAYRRVDMSMGYPLIRALPVLMIALLTTILPPHRTPGLTGGGGLLLVCGGCLLMPLRRFRDFRPSGYRNPAMKFILAAAAGTTAYTLLDAFALNRLKTFSDGGMLDSGFYLFLIEFGITAALGIVTFASRRERQALSELLRTRPWQPFAAGIASSTAYVLILYAMTQVTQLSFLQAFRQISLPFGVLLGGLVLKEKIGAARWAGVALIVSGLALIAFQ